MSKTGEKTIEECFGKIYDLADNMALRARPLEETFEELDRLIEKMQTPDMSLEDTFECYKRGLTLVEVCNEKIEKVECDIKKVTGNE